MIPVECLMGLSALLFFIDVFGLVTHHNLLVMSISVELAPSSADINFAVSNCILFPEQLEGFFLTLLSIDINAAETAVATAITVNAYRNFDSDRVNSIENMKL